MTDSPCINVCTVENGVCTACHRTVAEIANWPTMTFEEKQTVLERVNKRDD